MRKEQLLYLLEIDKCHSINAASQKLNISSQALGASIRSLENELDLLLLVRTHVGVSLTENGQSIVDLARHFWDGVTQLQKENLIPQKRTLTIYCTYGCLYNFIPAIISELAEVAPHITVQVKDMAMDQLYQALRDQEADFGLVSHFYVAGKPLLELPEDLDFYPFMISKLFCMVPRAFPCANYKTLSIKTAAQFPALLFSPIGDKTCSLWSLVNHVAKLADYEIESNHVVYKTRLVSGDRIGFAITTPFKESLHYQNFLKNIPITDDLILYTGYFVPKGLSCPKIEELLALIGLHVFAIN